MSSIPGTRYAKSCDNYVAYQIMGEGPINLVYVPGFISHLDLLMGAPPSANLFRRCLLLPPHSVRQEGDWPVRPYRPNIDHRGPDG
jgi:hypothetical protein